MMKCVNGRLWVAWFALLLIGSGCRRDSETVAPETPAKAEAPRQAAPDETSPISQAPNSSDPAAQFTTIRDNLVQGRGDQILARLPPGWRNDLASTMRPWMAVDPETRATFLDAVSRAARAIGTKADLIAASEALIVEGPWAPVLDHNLASLARATAAVAEWPGWLATGEFDTDGLVHAIVTAVASEPDLTAALKSLVFETVSASDGSGVVRYRAGGEGDWRTIPVARRDGIWLPTQLIKDWKQTSQRELEPADLTERLRQLTGRLDSLSKTLEKVSTQAEFDEVAKQAARSLLAGQSAVDPTPRTVTDEEFVWVQVSGEFSEDELDQLLWNIAGRADSPASAVADLREADDGAAVRIRVGPVADLQAFARRLTGLTIEEIDEEKRTITARFVRDRSP